MNDPAGRVVSVARSSPSPSSSRTSSREGGSQAVVPEF